METFHRKVSIQIFSIVFLNRHVQIRSCVTSQIPNPFPMFTPSLESSLDKRFNLNYSSTLFKNDRKVLVLGSFTFSHDPKLYPSKLGNFEEMSFDRHVIVEPFNNLLIRRFFAELSRQEVSQKGHVL